MFAVNFRKHVQIGRRTAVVLQTRTFTNEARAAQFAHTLGRRNKLNPAIDRAAGKLWYYSQVRIAVQQPSPQPKGTLAMNVTG
jgi:hypothetical protein